MQESENTCNVEAKDHTKGSGLPAVKIINYVNNVDRFDQFDIVDKVDKFENNYKIDWVLESTPWLETRMESGSVVTTTCKTTCTDHGPVKLIKTNRNDKVEKVEEKH